MELLRLLFDSEIYKDTCCLCFKCDKNNLDIYSILEISHEYCNISLSLANMLKSLFTFQDFLFRQVCNNCLDLICNVYTLTHKREIKILLLNNILNQLERKTNEMCIKPDNNKTVFINLELPIVLKSHNNKFVHKKNVEYHDGSRIYKHGQDNKVIVKICPQCSVAFQNIDQFKSHLRNMHTTKLQRKRNYYYCNDCNYKTLSKSTLQGHINKYHLNTRPHTCQVCCKSFYNQSNLNEHLRIHNNQRNEICEICGYTFLHKKNLLEHLRLHSDIRPYQCNICSKKFVTSGRRSDHIKRSHMEKSECCSICNKKYSLKKELTRHLNNVHSISMS